MKVHKKNISVPFACAIGAIGSVVILMISVLISALFLFNERLSISYIALIRIGTLYLAPLIGVIITVVNLQEKKIVASIITGTIIAIIQIGISLVFYKNITGSILLNLTLIILATITSILIFRKNKPVRRKKLKIGPRY